MSFSSHIDTCYRRHDTVKDLFFFLLSRSLPFDKSLQIMVLFVCLYNQEHTVCFYFQCTWRNGFLSAGNRYRAAANSCLPICVKALSPCCTLKVYFSFWVAFVFKCFYVFDILFKIELSDRQLPFVGCVCVDWHI